MRCSTGCARRSWSPTNVDVPAFHEGFADLVALFLHFSYADVVERAHSRRARHASTRGVAADRYRARVRLCAGAHRHRRGAAIGRRRRRHRRRSIPTVASEATRRDRRRLRPDARIARARLGAGVGGVRGVRHDRPAQERAAASASPASIPQLERSSSPERSAGQGASRRRRATSRRSSSTSAFAPSTTARRRTSSSASICARMITADGDMERATSGGSAKR